MQFITYNKLELFYDNLIMNLNDLFLFYIP